jgi:hypothetical protein
VSGRPGGHDRVALGLRPTERAAARDGPELGQRPTPHRQGASQRSRCARRLAHRPDPIQPESPAEARLVRRLREWGLPEAALQHVVRDAGGTALARLDVVWPAQQVGLDYDGRRPHGPRAIEHDETRLAAVEALGWRVETADRLDLRPGETRLRGRLVALLRARPAA